MVDGKTINQLRQDLDNVTREFRHLQQIVAELQSKTKLMEGLDQEQLTYLIQMKKKES